MTEEMIKSEIGITQPFIKSFVLFAFSMKVTFEGTLLVL